MINSLYTGTPPKELGIRIDNEKPGDIVFMSVQFVEGLTPYVIESVNNGVGRGIRHDLYNGDLNG